MPLTASAILEHLDKASGWGWPDFTGDATTEYHALRMIAAREAEGDGWGVAFESIRGSFIADVNEEPFAACIWTRVYGSKLSREARNAPPQRSLGLNAPRHEERLLRVEGILVEGPAGPLACKDAMIRELDLRPGLLNNVDRSSECPADVLLIRAYLARFPASLWHSPEDALEHLGLESPRVVVVCDAFAHVLGRRATPYGWAPLDRISVLPSTSDTYRSLADALETREASRFRSGTSNLDWRNWVRFRDENALVEAGS
jgi:hypothetical protein